MDCDSKEVAASNTMDAEQDEDIGATGGDEAKWPRPVDFRENDPKKGYVYIIVSIPELTMSSSIIGKSKPENIEIYNPNEIFREKEVYLRVKATNSEGITVTYEYKKNLPKPIDPKGSLIKCEKGIIKLRMKKEDGNLSWAAYSKYLRSRNVPTT